MKWAEYSRIASVNDCDPHPSLWNISTMLLCGVSRDSSDTLSKEEQRTKRTGYKKKSKLNFVKSQDVA